MNGIRYVVFLIVATFVVAPVQAAERLNKKQTIKLLSGTTMSAYYMKEGQTAGLVGKVRLKIKFHDDGGAEKTTYRADSARKSRFVEKGKWWVNKKGKLCLEWTPENKKRCGRILRESDQTYVLQRKRQKIIIEEIIEGT